MDSLIDRKYVFGSVMIVANMMDTQLERQLKEHGITAKQWFLTAVIENSFDQPPTLKEAAHAMGSSHQNVKQLALKLQEKGMVILEKDAKDARVTRIRLTEQTEAFKETIQSKSGAFTRELFNGVDGEDMAKARMVLKTMMDNLLRMAEEGD
jgi:DNA-binding MarR family transcriptional regulator